MPKVYLAGPMRLYKDFNFPAFTVAAKRLREAGYEVFSPAERDYEHGFDPRGYGTDEELEAKNFNLREAFAADMEYICLHADVVAVLPKWETSRGARIEAAAAWMLGLPVHSVGNLVAFGMNAPQVKQPAW